MHYWRSDEATAGVRRWGGFFASYEDAQWKLNFSPVLKDVLGRTVENKIFSYPAFAELEKVAEILSTSIVGADDAWSRCCDQRGVDRFVLLRQFMNWPTETLMKIVTQRLVPHEPDHGLSYCKLCWSLVFQENANQLVLLWLVEATKYPDHGYHHDNAIIQYLHAIADQPASDEEVCLALFKRASEVIRRNCEDTDQYAHRINYFAQKMKESFDGKVSPEVIENYCVMLA